MKIAFLEPHLRVVGDVRHMLELGNELVRRGHEVTYLLPLAEPLRCEWLECLGRLDRIESGFRQPFDVLVFNEETQWTLVDSFKHIGLTVYYMLGYGVLCDKAGSRESYRYPVDLRLANSNWTADRIAEEIGVRPTVILPGINPKHFRPVAVRKSYDVLTYGSARPSKGTREVEEACRKLGVRLEKYEGKNLPQERMAEEYCRARVFAVGSYVEGFGMPGLEALACGVPLVTTDNGGCREYGVHEQTALVVPPRDADALAEAIGRLLEDRKLAARLRENGLRLVREEFSWPDRARQFDEAVSEALAARQQLTLAIDRAALEPRLEAQRRLRAAQVAAYTRLLPLLAPGDSRREKIGAEQQRLTSIISLSWDQPLYTRAFVESVRTHTDPPYELIIVDNGSREETREYVQEAADRCLLNPENVGFARGMNQGAKEARGEYLVFINNDTVVPPGWLPRLIEAANLADGVGIVAPAVTAGGSFITVRSEPHELVREVLPFSLAPAAVCYLMPRAAFEEAGGWSEEYRLGGAEDVDLCFTMWAQGRKVLVDERVLITHHSKGTVASKVADWQELWRRNRQLLVDRWSAAAPLVAPEDGELEALLAALREATGSDEAERLLGELSQRLARQQEAWAQERASMAAGVAQSWREAARQREMAANLRKRLRSGLLGHLYWKYVRPRLGR